MKKKIILNVLFEKKRVLVLFMVFCIFLIVYTSIQMVFVASDRNAVKSKPDFVFSGTVYQSEDGSYPFRGYNSIGGFYDKVKEIAGEDADCYPVVYRSLYNYYDELTSVGFFGAVYGVSDDCIQKYIFPFIETGKEPAKGKKEALIGYYFAQRFGIGIGDRIPQALTLSEEWDETDIDSYTVCGILNENVSEYFNGSAVISRETYEAENGAANDNMVLGYYTDSSRCEEIYLSLNEARSEYPVPEGVLNYKQKEYSNLNIWINVIIIAAMSVVLMTAILSYLMKGITPKVGLLKAIGVSTKYILSTFLLGILIVFVLSFAVGIGVSSFFLHTMNQYVSDFYHFEVHAYTFTPMVLALDFAEFLFVISYVCLNTFAKCKLIMPKAAMTRTV